MSRVERQSVTEQIKDALLERILAGTYGPGERLVELQLAKEFGTSQGPVREALQGLAARRLVEASPHRGTRVRDVSPREMIDTYEVRGIIEQAAAELLERQPAQDWSELAELVTRIDQASLPPDVDAYAENDRLFHRSIVAASGNDVLLRTWDELRMQVRIRIVASIVLQSLPAFAQEHHAVLDALRAREFVLAGTLLRAHAEGIRAEIERFHGIS